MPSLPGIDHMDAVRALENVGFRGIRQGMHIIMSNGAQRLSIPRHHPVNAHTMGGIIRNAGLTIERFRDLR